MQCNARDTLCDIRSIEHPLQRIGRLQFYISALSVHGNNRGIPDRYAVKLLANWIFQRHIHRVGGSADTRREQNLANERDYCSNATVAMQLRICRSNVPSLAQLPALRYRLVAIPAISNFRHASAILALGKSSAAQSFAFLHASALN
jgi:hypothetical protein